MTRQQRLHIENCLEDAREGLASGEHEAYWTDAIEFFKFELRKKCACEESFTEAFHKAKAEGKRVWLFTEEEKCSGCGRDEWVEVSIKEHKALWLRGSLWIKRA